MIREYNIFISSTFKDMDAERDAIKFNVIPMLNLRYKEKMIQFRAIDLRFGINTEGFSERDSELAVLETCLSDIDKSRPFFIGLLGERYGWIPERERINTVLSRLSEKNLSLIGNEYTPSVTELEMLYGTSNDKADNFERALFFVRDNASYKNIPVELLEFYDDDYNKGISSSEKTERKERLNSLKEKILQQNYTEYHIDWDSRTNGFAGLDNFANIVFNRLCWEIDKEIGTEVKPIDVLEAESLATDYYVSKSIKHKHVPHEFAQISNILNEHQWVILYGEEGIGKSVLLSQLYDTVSKEQNIVALYAHVGLSAYSKSIPGIINRWIWEISNRYDIPTRTPADKRMDDYITTINDFYEIVKFLKQKGIQFVCFLDGIGEFKGENKYANNLGWVKSDICFVGTLSCDENLYQHLISTGFYGYDMKSRKIVDESLLNVYECYYNINLPQAVRESILENFTLPSQVSNLMLVLNSLGQDDFMKVRAVSAPTEMQKINTYIASVFKKIHTEDGCMFKYILDFIVNNIKRPHLKKMIEYIVASNMGLRESDLNLLMKNEWDELGFHLLTNMLGEYFLHDPITKQWRIASSTFTNSLLDKEYRLKLLNDIAVIVNGYDVQDEIKKTMGTYYNIMSGRKDFISQAFTKGFLSSDDPKWNIATTTALSDEGFESWLPHCCDSLLPDEQINIIYSYYRSIDFQNASYFLKVIYKQVKKISPESLSIEAAYAYAHIVKEYMLLTKTSGSETIYPDVLEKAIEIYSHCYNINPEYLDTINMYKAMLSEKLVVLGMKGDFLGMKNLYETINNIG